MDIAKTLKFVQGSVSRKTALPELTHFTIIGGRVTGYNGMISISCPIDCDIDCRPKADMLVKAIGNCDDTVQLSLTPAGALRVVSGAFRALVPCMDLGELMVQPQGESVVIPHPTDFLRALRTVEPFIGDDAAKPWVNGVLFASKSLYATCNVVAVQQWLGFDLPHVVNVPGSAIREVLRIGEAPTHMQVHPNSVTFHYGSGSWICTNLYESKWPNLDNIFDQPCQPTAIDERIFEGLAKLKAFTSKDNRILFGAGRVHTHDDLQEGGLYDLPGSEMTGIYSLDMLMLLKGVAKQIDFTSYPKPCIFFGDGIRGAIIGRSH